MTKRGAGWIVRKLRLTHRAECKCAEYLAPVKSWADILNRYHESSLFSFSLQRISDTSEDYIIDLYQCSDCGRYWAHEDVGMPMLTLSMPFFYFVDTQDPESLLDAGDTVKGKLKYDGDFRELILPIVTGNKPHLIELYKQYPIWK